MRILVSAASKHGATMEIARRIAHRLADGGEDAVTVRPLTASDDVAEYDLCVLGSAIYMGHWLEPARALILANSALWQTRSIWLFSSGPVGDRPGRIEGPLDIADLIRVTSAADHVIFGGKLDLADLSLAERALVRALQASLGDFRDWRAVDRWVDKIAANRAAEHRRAH